MTLEEHALMMGMFAVQMEALHTMADALKSRGILEGDDLHAFWNVRPHTDRTETVERVHKAYAEIAKQFGIDIPEAAP
jgi:hypothetical protein